MSNRHNTCTHMRTSADCTATGLHRNLSHWLGNVRLARPGYTKRGYPDCSWRYFRDTDRPGVSPSDTAGRACNAKIGAVTCAVASQIAGPVARKVTCAVACAVTSEIAYA